jgi:TolB-like protein/Flp pilus assembly protein TadD
VIVLFVVLGVRFWSLAEVEPDDSLSSIAVLPFKPLADNAQDRALELGMADTLIARLGNNRGIIVRPLSSVLRFDNLEQDAIQAGRLLEVANVLDGSIQRSEARIRVSVRLLRTADGTPLWVETFDENYTDIYAVQDIIARKIAAALEVHLSVAERSRLERRFTSSSEAYELFLKGRYYHQRTASQPDFLQAIAFYQRAIEIDPNYAPAYAALADAYRTLPMGGYVASGEAFPRAKAAAQKALEIDADLTEAHVALGWIAFFYEWDWENAESHLRRALENTPNKSEAHRAYGHLFSNLGRHDEAIEHAEIARRLAPLTNLNTALEGQFLFYAGRYEQAIPMFQKVLENDPNNWMAINGLGRVYTLQGRFDEAVAAFRLARDVSANAIEPAAQLGYVLAKSGQSQLALATLSSLDADRKGTYVPAYSYALIYNGLGRTPNALDQLERSFKEREVQMSFIKIDTRWDNLRSNSRFRQIVEKMGLD